MKRFWYYLYKKPILGFLITKIIKKRESVILSYSKTGEIIFLDLNGRFIREESITEKKAIYSVKVLDINNDGCQELILGGMDGILRVFSIIDKFNLNLLWTHKFNSSISGILLDDITCDGNIEVIAFSLDNTIRVFDINGNFIWGQVFEKGIGDAFILVNKEKKIKQLYAAGNDGTVRVFDGKTGEMLWFKTFSNKIRCLSIIKSIDRSILICGGDDKILHFIDINNHKEIRNINFSDYIWKCISYPKDIYNNIVVSTYSFDYFEKIIPLDRIKFSSEILCLNNLFEVVWNLKELNAECLLFFMRKNLKYIGIGTTKGEIALIDEPTGKIISCINENSCTNMVKYYSKKDLIISCHDNGKLNAYYLEEL